jgi:hypothetical protein
MGAEGMGGTQDSSWAPLQRAVGAPAPVFQQHRPRRGLAPGLPRALRALANDAVAMGDGA